MHTETSIREMFCEDPLYELIGTLVGASEDDLMGAFAYLAGYSPDAFAVLANQIEACAEPEQVPWPTGLCGHPVDPAEFAQGCTRCADCRATDALAESIRTGTPLVVSE